MKSASKKIARRIRSKGRGWVFTPKDFLDIGARATVDQALSRLVHKAIIRRLDRGIYDFPKTHDKLGMLSPSPDNLATAVANQTGDFIFPSGARAANMLGLSEQVPAKSIYLTTGASKTRKIGAKTLSFCHANIPTATKNNYKAILVIQALLHIGKAYIDDNIVRKCSDNLSLKDKKILGKMTTKLPDWLIPFIHRIGAVAHG
jgi:hypothetical protein